MKCHVSYAVLLLAVSASTGFAQVVSPNAGAGTRTGVQVHAIAGRDFGSSRYEMNALAPDPRDPQTLVDIRSRLEFPLDAVVAGARIVWQPGIRALRRWQFGTELLANLGDPGNRMTDRDFVADREVVHTESYAQLDLWQAVLDAEYLLLSGDRTSVSLLFVVDYLRIDQYIVGYEGWQRSLFSDNTFDISGSDPVLDYEVIYFSLRTGAENTHRLGEHLELGIAGSGGILFAHDKDNHLKRNRTAEGQGTGVALNALLQLRFMPGTLFGVRISGRAGAQIAYLYAEGHTDQQFANGKTYDNLPYLLESLQQRVFVSLGASF